LIIDKTAFNGIILAPRWETSTGCKNEKRKFEDKMGSDLITLLYDEIIREQPVLYDVGN
jgi:hypothetical protein